MTRLAQPQTTPRRPEPKGPERRASVPPGETVPLDLTPDEEPERPRGIQSSPGRVLRRRLSEGAIRVLLQLAAGVSILTSLAILGILVGESLPFFEEVSPWDFLTGTNWAPLMEPRSFGVLPLIGGTLLVTLVAALVVIPVGSLAAMYLSEYATPKARKRLKPALEVLAGIPTVVYGYFALIVVTPLVRLVLPTAGVFNALSAGIVVAIMIIPTVASLSDDAMRSVPKALREAGFGLGATRREVTVGVVFPGALSGILSAYVLAIGRAIGETMIVTMAAGATPRLTANPLQSIQTMTGYIVQVSLGDTPAGTVEFRTIFAVGLALFAMTLMVNMASFWIRKRFREAYS